MKCGTIFAGRYRVIHEIGSGGMGAVYSSVDLDTGDFVAIKILRDDLADNDEAVVRFRREIDIAKKLRHENICELLDHGIVVSDRRPFFFMPILPGMSLKERLRRESLSVSEAVEMVKQVLCGLEEAHSRDVVHRDLKPSNLFLCMPPGAKKFTVKILDFGVSKDLSYAGAALTSTGIVVGTSYYMAPEQARGDKIDGRVDVYSTGVILYQVLTGKMPFNADSYEGVREKILSAPFKSPRLHNPLISSSLEDIVVRAMARDPNNRFSSAEEMRSALDEVSLAPDGDMNDLASCATSDTIKIPDSIKKIRGQEQKE